MTYQTVNLGAAPTGAGGDTFRSTGAKINENFTNNTHAASRYVGTAAGNVMEVGAFGVGPTPTNPVSFKSLSATEAVNVKSGFYSDNDHIGEFIIVSGNSSQKLLLGWSPYNNNIPCYQSISFLDPARKDFATAPIHKFYTTQNTTVDANGVLKAASPIVKLYAEKIELNDEAAEQPLSFEKLDVGHYLVKGSTGFAKEGWWIEIPTDTHGNKICAVEYQTLENGDLEIKTFKKKQNDEGDIVANLEAPIDIPNNANGEPRWIDIRLNEIKKPVVIATLRTEKQPRMVQQIKYSMQPTFMTKLTDLIDDEGKVVIVNGKPFQKKETYLVTDSSGIATLTKQPVINENGETVFELVQAVDSEGKPIFDDVPVLDKDGNPIYDEVIHDPE